MALGKAEQQESKRDSRNLARAPSWLRTRSLSRSEARKSKEESAYSIVGSFKDLLAKRAKSEDKEVTKESNPLPPRRRKRDAERVLPRLLSPPFRHLRNFPTL